MKRIQVLMVCLAILCLAACGGKKSSSNNDNKNVTLSSITPATASVYTTQNQQFTATAANGTTNTITWEVNGVPFGSSANGFISSAGLYTAPATVPTPAAVTITAVANDDTTKTSTATATVVLGANLSITPSSLTMDAGATQTFVVMSNGGPAPDGVTFSLSCHTAGQCGSVTADGVYTAPLSPPSGNVILTASIMQGTGSFSTSATITILPSSQSTTGQYAFSLSGTNNGAAYSAAGSISLDGMGGITGGAEDVNSGGTVSSVSITGGTYTFDPTTGRIAANVQTDNGNVTWYMTLVNRQHGYIEYAGSGISASGAMALQDSGHFDLASVNGIYVFRLAGSEISSGKRLSVAGAIAASNSSLGSGLLDANTGGTLSSNQSVSGTITAPASNSGRGTLTLNSGFGTQTFAYYMVDGTQLKLVETDTAHSTAGNALQQTGTQFTADSFHGNYAMVLNGASGNGALGIGGTVALGSGAVNGGSLDRNDALTFIAGQSVSGGTYTVTDTTTGRTEATIMLNGGGTVPVVLYPVSTTQFAVLGAATTESTSGVAYLATAGSGSISELRGNYSVDLRGVTGTTPEDVVGVLIANGGGAFTGTLDITNGGAGTALQSSSYTVTSTSANTTLKTGFANFGSIGFNMYIVDSTRVLLLENDNKGVRTGEMQVQ